MLADQNDVFRILFNLLNNAVKVAHTSHALRRIDVSISRAGKSTEVKITDNGPGLPSQVVARLFRGPAEGDATHGHGLAIARELAERNGGTLTCKTSHKGTLFRLELTALTSIGIADDSVTRSLGRRASG